MNLKIELAMFETAIIWSKLSTCKRKQVGAVISRDKRILITAYNGTLSGKDNNCEKLINEKNVTCKSVIHAEMNAIAFSAKNGININNCSIYITLSPCIECAKLIFQSGIKKVFYIEEYRDREGIDFLIKNGLYIKQGKL